MKKVSSELANKKCIPCERNKGTRALSKSVAKEFLKETPAWKLLLNHRKISRNIVFKDFVQAMGFIKTVATIAEKEGHHPDIFISYNKVKLELTTHSIGGLSQNDFILAAKIDGIRLF